MDNTVKIGVDRPNKPLKIITVDETDANGYIVLTIETVNNEILVAGEMEVSIPMMIAVIDTLKSQVVKKTMQQMFEGTMRHGNT